MALKYQHPFPKVPHYDDDDPFGNTSPPYRSPKSPHRGADYNKGIAEIPGTAIPAIADGVVVFSGTAPGLGNMVTLQHSDGMFSGYCHQNVPSPLTYGQTVTRGSRVGGIGGTNGTSQPYNPHLHLTMGSDIAGTQGGASRFDPIPYIDARLTGDEGDTMTPAQEAALNARLDRLETAIGKNLPGKLYRNKTTGAIRAINEATGLDYPIINPEYYNFVTGHKVFEKSPFYEIDDVAFNFRREAAKASRDAIAAAVIAAMPKPATQAGTTS